MGQRSLVAVFETCAWIITGAAAVWFAIPLARQAGDGRVPNP
jgi:hypothetical protein